MIQAKRPELHVPAAAAHHAHITSGHFLKLPILVLGVFAVARGELGVRGLATELVPG